MNGLATDSLGLVRFAERPPRPWNNGSGSTRELAKRLLGVVGPDFVWRISVAEVTEETEFALFPGVQRTVTPIWGDGVSLDVGTGVDTVHHDLEKFRPFAFDAAMPVTVHPKAGPARLLNVMTKTNRMVAKVDVVDLTTAGPVSLAGATSWVQLTGDAQLVTSDGRAEGLAPLDAAVPRQRVRLVHGTGLGAVVRMTNYRAFQAVT